MKLFAIIKWGALVVIISFFYPSYVYSQIPVPVPVILTNLADIPALPVNLGHKAVQKSYTSSVSKLKSLSGKMLATNILEKNSLVKTKKIVSTLKLWGLNFEFRTRNLCGQFRNSKKRRLCTNEIKYLEDFHEALFLFLSTVSTHEKIKNTDIMAISHSYSEALSIIEERIDVIEQEVEKKNKIRSIFSKVKL